MTGSGFQSALENCRSTLEELSKQPQIVLRDGRMREKWTGRKMRLSASADLNRQIDDMRCLITDLLAKLQTTQLLRNGLGHGHLIPNLDRIRRDKKLDVQTKIEKALKYGPDKIRIAVIGYSGCGKSTIISKLWSSAGTAAEYKSNSGISWHATGELLSRPKTLRHLVSSYSTEGIIRAFSTITSLISIPTGKKRVPGQCRRLALPCLLLWATPVAAEREFTSTTALTLQDEVKGLLLKTMMPWENHTEIPISPEALLIACFLCTAFTVLLFTTRRRDYYLKYFVTAGMAISTIAGAACSADVQDFVFRYLFVGLNVSMILGILCHRCEIIQPMEMNESLKFTSLNVGQEFKLESGTIMEEKTERL